VGWSFVLMFSMSGGSSLKPVFPTRVQCGFGGILFLCEGVLVVDVNGHEELAVFLHSEMKLQYFEAVLSSKAALNFAQGHVPALLQAPPVWYLVQHSESVPLNFGMPSGTLPLGKLRPIFRSV
jgi:hypothetical protein